MLEIVDQHGPLSHTSFLVERLAQTRTACAALLLGSTLATSGCFFGSSKKPPKVFVPPPVYSTAPAPPANPQPVILTPPLDAAAPVDPGVETAVGTNLPPAPPKPLPPKTTPVKPPPTVVDVTPPPVVPPPKPTTIFSNAERAQMNQEIDQSLGRVRTALAKVEGKNLSADLTALANNARAQMMNAEQTRVQDPVTAVNLAKRAESFAMELVQRLP